jgi:hypothetical protein
VVLRVLKDSRHGSYQSSGFTISYCYYDDTTGQLDQTINYPDYCSVLQVSPE